LVRRFIIPGLFKSELYSPWENYRVRDVNRPRYQFSSNHKRGRVETGRYLERDTAATDRSRHQNRPVISATPPERNMIAGRRWFRCRALKYPGGRINPRKFFKVITNLDDDFGSTPKDGSRPSHYRDRERTYEMRYQK
jgi:hypothetical protein